MSTYENNGNMAFDFDSEVTIEHSVGNVLLDEGPARFTVTEFGRGRFAGSAKMSPGPQANLVLQVTDARNQTAQLRVTLILNEKMLWKITNFFRSIGLVSASADGSRLKLPWNEIVGKSGVCEIEHSTWTDNTGANRVSAQVKDFLYGTSAVIGANAQMPAPAPAPTVVPAQTMQYQQPAAPTAPAPAPTVPAGFYGPEVTYPGGSAIL